MTIATTPHLNFRGDARSALEFYQSVFGGQLAVVTHAQVYGDVPAEEAELVSWGQVEAENGFRIMAYDVPASIEWSPGVIPFFVSARGAEAAEVEGYWSKLADGATVIVPFGPTAWSPAYGMLRDRFGITWVLDVAVAWEG